MEEEQLRYDVRPVNRALVSSVSGDFRGRAADGGGAAEPEEVAQQAAGVETPAAHEERAPLPAHTRSARLLEGAAGMSGQPLGMAP